jgi:hypothetical protein
MWGNGGAIEHVAALGAPRKRILGIKIPLRCRGLPCKGQPRALDHQLCPIHDLAISPAGIDTLGGRINKQCPTIGLTFITDCQRASLEASDLNKITVRSVAPIK